MSTFSQVELTCFYTAHVGDKCTKYSGFRIWRKNGSGLPLHCFFSHWICVGVKTCWKFDIWKSELERERERKKGRTKTRNIVSRKKLFPRKCFVTTCCVVLANLKEKSLWASLFIHSFISISKFYFEFSTRHFQPFTSIKYQVTIFRTFGGEWNQDLVSNKKAVKCFSREKESFDSFVDTRRQSNVFCFEKICCFFLFILMNFT